MSPWNSYQCALALTERQTTRGKENILDLGGDRTQDQRIWSSFAVALPTELRDQTGGSHWVVDVTGEGYKWISCVASSKLKDTNHG